MLKLIVLKASGMRFAELLWVGGEVDLKLLVYIYTLKIYMT